MASSNSASSSTQNSAADAGLHQRYARDYLPRLYASDPTLVELDLDATNCGDVAVTALADALKHNTTVTSLKLCSNGITDEGVGHLAEVLRSNHTLRRLALDFNNLTDRGVYALASASEDNDVIVALTVESQEHPISEAAASALSTVIRLNLRPRSLKELVLSVQRGSRPKNIDLSYTGGHVPPTQEERQRLMLDDFCATVVAGVVKQCTQLSSLCLADNAIGDTGVADIAAAIAQHQLLDRVDLSGNLITNVGVDLLLDALQENHSVRAMSVLRTLASPESIIRLEMALLVNGQPPRLKMYLPRIRHNDETLSHLELDDHQSQRYYNDVSVQIVLSAVQESGNTNLISLAMPNAQFGYAAAASVGKYLSGYPLTAASPLYCVAHLRVLDLSNNAGLGPHTTPIAEALTVNSTLQSLSLSACNVSDAAASAFASMLEVNSSLTHLDLSFNPEIRDSGALFAYAFNVNRVLTSFSLDRTGVTEKVMKTIEDRRMVAMEPAELQNLLPPMYEGDESLTEIHLRGDTDIAGGHTMRDSSLRLLSQPLKANYFVTSVDVSHNKISIDGVSSLVAALQENRITIKRIDLSHNPIGHGAQFGRLLGSLVSTHIALRELRVTNTGLGTDGARALLSELDVPRCNSLQHLDITENDVQASVAKHIEWLVASNAHDLCFKLKLRSVVRAWSQDLSRGVDTVRMDFSGFAVTEAGDAIPSRQVDAMIAILCDFLSYVPTLETFTARRNNISDYGAACIAAWLVKSSVTALDLRDNDIGDDGCDELATAVRNNYKVHSVEIGGNPRVSAAVAKELSSMLRYNDLPHDIKEVIVSVGNNTAKSIDESFRTIRHLDDSHVDLIAKEMVNNHTITSINLSNNYITAAGFKTILHVLSFHKALAHVLLSNTLITGSAELGQDVAEMLLHTTTLKTLDLSFNDFSNSFIPPILTALEKNQSVRLFGLQEAGVAKHLELAVTSRVWLNSERRLKELATKLRSNDPTLTELSLSGCGWTVEQFEGLWEPLANNTVVTTVAVSNNVISSESAVNFLLSNKSVTQLDLSHNCLKPAVVIALTRVLRLNNTLRSLDIRGNPELTVAALQPLRYVVDENQTLRDVKAGTTAEYEAAMAAPLDAANDAAALSTLLRSFEFNQQPTLKQAVYRMRDKIDCPVLDAAKDPLGVTDFGLKALCEAAPGRGLTTIIAPNGNLTDRCLPFLRRLILEEELLTYIDISGNKITDEGIAVLAGVIAVGRSLRYVNVHRNPFTQVGVETLSNACAINTRLLCCVVTDADAKVRSLVQPFVPAEHSPVKSKVVTEPTAALVATGDDPTTLLSKAVFLNSKVPQLKRFLTLEDTSSVTDLDLSDLAGVTMKDFVPDCPSELRTVRGFDDGACAVLCDALAINQHLVTLSMAGNGLGPRASTAIANMLRANRGLRVLDISRNKFSTSASLIADAVAVNDTIIYVNIADCDSAHYVVKRVESLAALNQEPIVLKRAVIRITEEKWEPREVTLECERTKPHGGLPSRGDPDAVPLPNETEWEEDEKTSKRWCTELAHHAVAANWGSLRKPQLDDGSIALLCNALSTNLSVRKLGLAHNAITDFGVTRLVNFFEDGRSGIASIDLAHNLITAKAAVALAQLAEVNGNISAIDVSSNVVSASCVSDVLSAARSNAELREFHLANTRVPPDQIESVERILRLNRLGMADLRQHFIGAFTNSPQTTQLDLSGLAATRAYTPALVSVLQGVPAASQYVKRLALEFNDLTSVSLPPLADLIANWPSLRELSLGCNYIVDVSALCAALKQPTCGVNALDLRSNRLDTASAKSISDMLRESDTLTYLDVSKNSWGAVGAAIILGALPMNDGLMQIDIAGPGIPDSVVERVQNAITLHYKKIALPAEIAAGSGAMFAKRRSRVTLYDESPSAAETPRSDLSSPSRYTTIAAPEDNEALPPSYPLTAPIITVNEEPR